MPGLKPALAALVLLAAAAAGLSGRWPWRRLETPPVPVVAAPIVAVREAYTEVLDTLRRGETLSHLFARQGLEGFDVGPIASVLDPRRLRSGLVFNFRRVAADSAPHRVSVRPSPEQRIVLRRASAGWNAEVEPIAWAAQELRIEGAIDHSLYEALDAQVGDTLLGAEDRVRLAWALADVYAWQVDFTRDIRPGDRFRVVIERLVSEDGEVRFGRVLAGDLTMGGKSLTAFRYVVNGHTAFYDADGNSLRRAFLRAPVEFRRISSNFTRARRHPVLGRVRRHEGTDYAAAPGTPVQAAGDGVILRAGRAGGYGNLVELRHRNGVTTRYGHLRGFARGIRAGARVRQGQTIGYVGSTGLATGPHLHYEFRVNGVAVDSRRVNVGRGTPLPSAERPAFERERDRLRTLLDGTPPHMIAGRSMAGGTGELQ